MVQQPLPPLLQQEEVAADKAESVEQALLLLVLPAGTMLQR